MHLGVGLPSFASESRAVSPDRFRRYAELADDYGFAGAWLIDHIVKPARFATSFLDPLTALSVVAGATKSIPVGTSILVLPIRDPVLVAKRAATLQHLSNRRVTLGLGLGYAEAEFDAVGIPIEERSERFLEALELLSRLFTQSEVTYEGEFYAVEGFSLEPELSQAPRLLVGGGGVDTPDGRRMAKSVKERMRHADGWIAPPRPPDVLEQDWKRFAEFLTENGRDPGDAYKVGLQLAHVVPEVDEGRVMEVQRNAYRDISGPDRPIDDAMDSWLSGPVDEIIARLDEYETQGFDEVILHPVVSESAKLNRQLRLFRDLLLTEYP